MRSIIPGRTAWASSVSAPQLKSIISPLPLAVQLGKAAGEPEAGIIDQQIGMLAMGGEVGHQPVDRAGQAQILADRPGIAELCGQRVEPVLAAGNEHQPLALRRQLAGEIDAESRRRAGD